MRRPRRRPLIDWWLDFIAPLILIAAAVGVGLYIVQLIMKGWALP